MFTITLTSYGQSQVSSQVSIDGFMLLYDYIADISSVTDTTGYTIQLDDETRGNYKNSVGSLVIKDLSNLEYQAKTILLYKVAGGYKRILGGYSQNSPIIQKNTDILNVCIAFDFSAFTNGFSFSYTQAGISTASHNSDGILHIENPSITSDDSYSVYSKAQTDALTAQTVKDAHYFVKGTQSSSTYAWTGSLGINALYDGLVINYFLPFAGVSSSYAQLTLTLANGTTTSAIPVYYRTSSRCTTQFPVGSIIQMTYMENVVIGSTTIAAGWFANVSYVQSDTNYYDRLRLNNAVYASTNGIFAYTIILRTGENTYTSVCASSSSAADKSPTQDEFYLDSILYYGNSIDVASGNATSTLTLYRAVDITASRSINASSLTASQPLYLKVKYNNATNKFYFDQNVNWWTQSLPNSYDGYYYVYLGSMYSTSVLTFDVSHPIYKYIADVGIREVSVKDLDGNAKTATKLASVIKIDGVEFDGSSSCYHFGRCTAAAATVDKTVDCQGFVLEDGARILVRFSEINSAVNPTLNVNNTGAKPIHCYGSNYVGRTDTTTWRGGSIIEFVYDATNEYWLWVGYQRYCVGCDSSTTSTYASYIGSTSTNRVATYSYSSATNRSFRPVVNYSTSAYVNLGSSSYKWGYVYANYIGSSSYKVDTVYATNLGASSYYVTNTYSTNVYADYLSATTIGATNSRVTDGYFTNLYATNIGSSTSAVTEAYIDNMTGTASYATSAGKATQDSKGSTIYLTYITDISTSVNLSSTTVYNTAAAGTTSSTISIPTSNLLLKNNNNAATKNTLSIAEAVAGTISNTDGIGMIRLVAFKTTANWTKRTTDIYISGSLLRPVDLRTEDNDTGCILRINAETTLNNSTYSGTWRVLHKIGNISSGNMFVALAIRIA